MAQIRLKKLLSHKVGGKSILQELESMTQGITLLDANQKVLLEATHDGSAREYPVVFDESYIGWVVGGRQAEIVARFLTYLAHKESENGELADELLGLYREINLLFHLSEKLGASLDVNVVMDVAVREASQLIYATSGAVILRESNSEVFKVRYTVGEEIRSENIYYPNEGIIGNLILKPDGEIINNVIEDRRYISEDGDFSSLICAPLKGQQDTIGLLLLVSRDVIMYTSPDLMLLTTVASHAAPAIANALLHEQTIHEGKKRETQLQLQIQQLQLELDEVRVNKAVSEIVETDYFRRIREQSQDLRQIFDNDA